MRELKFEELTIEQKLGIVTIATVTEDEKQLEYILELVKSHSVGAVWVTPGRKLSDIAIKKIKETADYPVLIMTDAEGGIGDFATGRHNAISRTGSEELAYIFGKVTAITARQMGYNVVCNPILDLTVVNSICGMVDRSLGPDKYQATAYAKAIARGMHDGGVLTVGKHYPGNTEYDSFIDSHMAESLSEMTKEELLDTNLYPYIELNKDGLLDGIMTKHSRFVNIDPDYPASLSKKLIDIIREQGFDGISLTDALCMHGVVTKFGKDTCIGLSVGNGNDLALAFNQDNRFAIEAMTDGYRKGVISDERLNEAVKRVLEAQKKVMAEPKYTSLTDEDIEKFNRFHTDGIALVADDGVGAEISRDGKHLFVILTDQRVDINKRDELAVDTFSHFWHSPLEIADKIESLFPNSGIYMLAQFPMISDNMLLMDKILDYDDVVFVTFFYGRPCMGRECFTSRVLTVFDSLQITDKISTVVHYGNPFVLEDIPHVGRILFAPGEKAATLAAIDILAGLYPPKGKLVYDVKLKKK